MSSNYPDTHLDLIDFHVRSPVLPRRSSIPEVRVEQEYENLIDTELPIFEQKLQTASSITGCHSRRTSIDVEDILINIDSDEYETDSLDGETVETGEFLDVCDGVGADNGNTETTLPVDNFEALLVLKNLDDLLNATLEESDGTLEGHSNSYQDTPGELNGSDQNAQQIIEECLEDLDNYLKAIEDDDSASRASSRSFSSDEQSGSRDGSSFLDFAGSSIFEEHEDSQSDFNEELVRNKLRKIEQNYSKFVSSGIVNRGYVDTENNANFTLDGHLRRPSSACAIASQLLSRKQPIRATTLSVVRKERPRLLVRRKSLNENNTAPHCTLSRTSGADADCNTPENWLTSGDVTRERHAHASGDCCTGTVTVEPLHRQSKANSSSATVVHEDQHEDPQAEALKEEVRRTLRGTWLRSSMRRLQHLNLPSADSADNGESAGSWEVESRLEVPSSNVRPVSAPSRLPPIRTPTGRSSRSRSRDSVSHEPNGRARSSSASSHSRRPRSLSSSVTSLASSVDSTLSRMPSSETRNGTSEQAADTRRALEAGRADEKAIKRAERDARLVEERRLAAVADFNQIVEIFSPPPKVETLREIEISEQDYKRSVQGVSNKVCDSSYETIYEDDIDFPLKIPQMGDDIPKSNESPDIPKTDNFSEPDFNIPKYNESAAEADVPKTGDLSQPDFDKASIIEVDISIDDDFAIPDFSTAVPLDEPGTPVIDECLIPDLSSTGSMFEADIPENNNSLTPDSSPTVPLVEADVPKIDDLYDTSKLYDQPIDLSVDDFTKSDRNYGGGDNESGRSDKAPYGVDVPDNNLDDAGYIIQDFDNIPMMPLEEEDRFPKET